MQEQIEQYRELLENISLARQVNESLAKKLITEFCNRLEGQLSLLHEIQQDREASKAVHSKLEIISGSLVKRAQKFYECFPDSLNFKDFLVECHQETNFAFTHNQVSRACRNAFRQIETLVSYILITSNLFEWLFDNPGDWIKYESQRKKLPIAKYDAPREESIRNLSNALSLFNKLWLVNNYFIRFFKNHRDCKHSLMSSFDSNKYNICYMLRNSDSHGWNFNSSSEIQESELALIDNDFEGHLRELMKIIIPIRDLAKSLKVEDFYVSTTKK